MSRKVFLSCVTNEFERYREMLGKDLRRFGIEVRVQDDFVVGRLTTLNKLDEYINDCDIVIHLIGSATGSPANPAEVTDLLQRYPDLTEKLNGLNGVAISTISYTQWEAWLAIYHRIPCLVYLAEDFSEQGSKSATPRGPRFVEDAAEKLRQKEHWRHLRLQGKDGGAFQDEQHLCREVLLSVRNILNPAEFADEDLLLRLPLPLAQLYRRTLNAKTIRARHLVAYHLWDAGIRLLGAVAVGVYAERGLAPDAQLAEYLTNLARPISRHWWEFLVRLAPLLAGAGETGFRAVHDLLSVPAHNDFPRAAALDAALRETLGEPGNFRDSVCLTELIGRLIRYGEEVIGGTSAKHQSASFDESMGKALLEGFREVLSRLDVLAGHRLLYLADIRPQPTGDWLVERAELMGEVVRRIESLAVSDAEYGRLPKPKSLYLAAAGPLTTPRILQPLVWHDANEGGVMFLNSPRGKLPTDYLDYASGRTVIRPDLEAAKRDLPGKILGRIVGEEQASEWAARSMAGEPQGEPFGDETLRSLGEFKLLSELGRGGMGVVYRAWQPSLGRQVALKKLQKTGDTKVESRFAREICALGRVEHPHLVKIFTSGSEGDQWYYAMELLEGTPLSTVCEELRTSVASVTALDLPTWQWKVSQVCEAGVRAEKPLSEQGSFEDSAPAGVEKSPNAVSALAKPFHSPSYRAVSSPQAPDRLPGSRNYVQQIAELVRQTADAAHALHEAGILHRDIKPGNIMVSTGRRGATLIDPGLAKLADEVEGRLTRTRQFVGTLRYASPEQVLAVGSLDRRSDIYSLGRSLWELLTLQPLYGAGEQMPTPELMRRIQYQEPERVRKYHTGVPKDLDAIVLKCLEKDVNGRYATAKELADDLRRFPVGPAGSGPAGRQPRAFLSIVPSKPACDEPFRGPRCRVCRRFPRRYLEMARGGSC